MALYLCFCHRAILCAIVAAGSSFCCGQLLFVSMSDFKFMDIYCWLGIVFYEYLWEHGMMSNGSNGIWLWYVWIDDSADDIFMVDESAQLSPIYEL